MVDFTNLFQDSAWRHHFSEAMRPHPVYVRTSAEGKTAALVVRRQRGTGDWSVNAHALDYMKAALDDGRLVAAYVVLIDNKSNICGHAELTEVITRIGDAAPIDGAYGPYFWLSETLMPVANGTSNEEPF
jgi:hypothetical protein